MKLHFAIFTMKLCWPYFVLVHQLYFSMSMCCDEKALNLEILSFINHVNVSFGTSYIDPTGEFIHCLLICVRYLIYRCKLTYSMTDISQNILMLDSFKPVEYYNAIKQHWHYYKKRRILI